MKKEKKSDKTPADSEIENDNVIVGEPVEETELVEDSVEELEDLELTDEERIKNLEKQLAEQKDKWLRLHAEFDNFRKRTYKDLSSTRIISQIDAATPFLQVFDLFKMGVTAADTAENMDSIREGLKMILNEFSKAMDELGITEIDATGKKFDPELHEAVDQEPSDEYEEGMVIKQWRCGYRMGERIIRPANVVVSSGSEDES